MKIASWPCPTPAEVDLYRANFAAGLRAYIERARVRLGDGSIVRPGLAAARTVMRFAAEWPEMAGAVAVGHDDYVVVR